jgi:predicted nucleic acid-binding protein
MKPKVYIETSIPSFYFEVRTDLEMAARREWTRTWWGKCRDSYQMVSSEAVFFELAAGNFPGRDDALELIRLLPLLAIEDPIAEIVEAYIKHQLMPADPFGDALHLAIASYHGCDFLLTWNCKHLANANKFAHIRRVNAILGIYCPSLVTPLELLEELE